jgi:hypothetical protein
VPLISYQDPNFLEMLDPDPVFYEYESATIVVAVYQAVLQIENFSLHNIRVLENGDARSPWMRAPFIPNP